MNHFFLSSHTFLSVIRIGHVLIFFCMPAGVGNEVFLTDYHLSVLTFPAFYLSDWILHVGPHVLKLFMGRRFKNFLVRD